MWSVSAIGAVKRCKVRTYEAFQVQVAVGDLEEYRQYTNEITREQLLTEYAQCGRDIARGRAAGNGHGEVAIEKEMKDWIARGVLEDFSAVDSPAFIPRGCQ